MRQPRKWTEVWALKMKYPGLPLKVYQYGTFKDPNDKRTGWKEDISKDEFVSTFGSKKLRKQHFENPSHKAFGQAYLIALALAWVVALSIKHYFKLPVVSVFIMTVFNWYIFSHFPNAMLFWKMKRNVGPAHKDYKKYERDLF